MVLVGRRGVVDRLAAACVVVLLGLAGCSSGDDNVAEYDSTAPGGTGAEADGPEPIAEEYDVPAGSRPHDVWVAEDGTVWFTAQGSGHLGRLDPESGEVDEIPLGEGSRPHGVIVGPDGAPWITDGGLNAIVRVDPDTSEVETFPLPIDENANLNTATFGNDGTLWFTGQAGFYGRLPAGEDQVEVFDAPRGPGPYGIDATPDGEVYYASLAGSHLAHVDTATGEATVLEAPTAEQGTRRVWSDSQGRLWTSQWNAGQVAVYDPATGEWQEWPLPGDSDPAQPYAVYVDDNDRVWLSDFGTNAVVEFDTTTEKFIPYTLPSRGGEVRQIHGRAGEIWGAESANDKLVVIHPVS